MWVCATGARHSKSLERRFSRTACLRRGPENIYSYYTRCALITTQAGSLPLAHNAQHFTSILGVEIINRLHGLHGMALHIQLRQKQRVSGKYKPFDNSREISKRLYYECQLKGSFCETRV